MADALKSASVLTADLQAAEAKVRELETEALALWSQYEVAIVFAIGVVAGLIVAWVF